MADKDGQGGSAKGGIQPKAPQKTIDLKPEEVSETKPGTQTDASKADASKADASKSEASNPDTKPVDAKPEAKKAESPAKPNDTKASDTKASDKPASAKSAAASAPKPPSSPRAATPPPPPPAKSGGGMGAVVPAVIGGVVGAGLIYALMTFGILPAPGGDDESEELIASLEERLGAEIADVRGAIPTVDGFANTADVESLQGELSALSESVGAAPEAVASVATLQSEVEALRSAVEAGVPAADGGAEAFAAVQAQVEALASRVEEATNAQTEATATTQTQLAEMAQVANSASAATDAVAPLTARLETLEADLGQLAATFGGPVDFGPVEARVAELAAQITDAGARMDSMDNQILETGATARNASRAAIAAREASTDVETSLATLDSRIAETETAVSEISEGLGDALSRIDSQIGDLSDAAASIDDERRAATLVAMAGLQRAIEGDGPFQRELESVKALAGDGAAFEALDAFAEAGVPSRERLARLFDGQIGGILEESAKAEADGILARLAANAQTLVSVRPTGFAAGDSDSAKVARIEQLLDEGKVDAALAEWETLSPAGQAASGAWADAARKRIELEATLSGLAQ
ncbi:MAG: hypothetical protein AAF638_03395 [Pseudomonadota bacterium]